MIEVKPNGRQRFTKIEMNVQPGDRMTGWEIIASLPLEEQRQLNNSALPQAMRDFIGKDYIQKANDDLYGAYIRACEALYEWDGTNWNEVKE